MSWDTSYNSNYNLGAERAKSVIKLVVILGLLGGGAYGLYSASKKPAYAKHIPTPARQMLAKMEAAYYDQFVGDLVVFTKHLKAKKLLAKDERIVTYSSGLRSRREAKTFLLQPNLQASVQVDRMPSPTIARSLMARSGGTSDDVMEVGAPSLFRTHGLDENYNYFMEVVAQRDQNFVTVKLVKVLDEREQAIAGGPQYETYMEALAEELWKDAQNVTRQQLRRLIAMDAG